MTEPIDHAALAETRIATQYKRSTKFRAFIAALMARAQELEDVFQKIALWRNIDDAEGVALDVIGDIVGVSRIIDDVILTEYFGFDGFTLAATFGEEGDPSVGARFREEDETNTGSSVLADPEYRLLIKAKIVRNHSTGTNDNILAGLSYLFGGVPTGILDSGGMQIDVAIGRPLTNVEVALVSSLDILPRPAGVRINGVVTYFGEQYFGFDDQPGAMGFGDEGDASVGGIMAEQLSL